MKYIQFNISHFQKKSYDKNKKVKKHTVLNKQNNRQIKIHIRHKS